MQYDAVLFDNDGVLTTITDWHTLRSAVRTAFESVGVVDPDEEEVDAMLGTTAETVRTICRRYDVDPETFWRRRDEAAADTQIAAIETGEKQLYEDVGAIDRLSVPRGIVSNNQDRTVKFIASHFELTWAEVVYGRDPTPQGIVRKKPNTYYLDRAMDALGTDPASERILYVGDSPKDLTAARRAGIDAAFVRRDHRANETLPYEPAYEVTDLDELVRRLLEAESTTHD